MSAQSSGDHDLVALCDKALKTTDSAAILACARRFPNNDWRKHQL